MKPSEAKEKYCPMTFNVPHDSFTCMTDKCMWWVNYECVVVSMWLNPIQLTRKEFREMVESMAKEG